MATVDAVATALPDRKLKQSTVKEMTREWLEAKNPDLVDMVSAFDNSGISQRPTVLEPDWYMDFDRGWADRTDAFFRTGLPLAEEVIDQLLEDTNTPASVVDGIVFLSTTGIGAPNLPTRLIQRTALPHDLTRVPIFGIGCSGGVHGLARTAQLADTDPYSVWLLVVLELGSVATWFPAHPPEPDDVVCAAIFSDACAGALVQGDYRQGSGLRFVGDRSHVIPGSMDYIGMDIQDLGFSAILRDDIPDALKEHFPEVYDAFLDRYHHDRDEVRPIFHPGGKTILPALQEATGYSRGDLAPSWGLFHDYGNLAAPSVLFTLLRSMEDDLVRPSEPIAMAGFGPGLGVELALLRHPAYPLEVDDISDTMALDAFPSP